MSLPVAAIPQLHVINTLGALLIGGLVASSLWGAACIQTYIYFQRGSNDRQFVKLLVAFLWCLDTFDSCLNGHILYHYFVTNYVNPFALAVPVWSVVLHVAMTSLSDFLVRSMFARRVWRLSGGNMILTGTIVAISFLDLACGIAITAKAFRIASFTELSGIAWLMYLNFASGFSSDACVALSLCYYLRKSRTGFNKTDSIINVLILYTVNTGLLTALDASFGMITYIAMPNNFIFLAFYLQLSKLYLNSYLATLNARPIIREKSDGIVSIHLSRLSQSRRFETTELEDTQPPSPTEKAMRGQLTVSVETIVDREPDDIER